MIYQEIFNQLEVFSPEIYKIFQISRILENKEDNEVDALAGATITGNGVSAMIKESLKLYKPYLQMIPVTYFHKVVNNRTMKIWPLSHIYARSEAPGLCLKKDFLY